jgi:hypothetical protein
MVFTFGTRVVPFLVCGTDMPIWTDRGFGMAGHPNPWKWRKIAVGTPLDPEVRVFMGLLTLVVGSALIVAGFSSSVVGLIVWFLAVALLVIGGLGIRSGIRAHRLAAETLLLTHEAEPR